MKQRSFPKLLMRIGEVSFEVNVFLKRGMPVLLFLPGMKKHQVGRIIFISSESGVRIPSEMIHYGMTKTAQLAVSRGSRNIWPEQKLPLTASCSAR